MSAYVSLNSGATTSQPLSSTAYRNGQLSVRGADGHTHIYKVERVGQGTKIAYRWALIPVIIAAVLAIIILLAPASATHGKAGIGCLFLAGAGVLLSAAWAKGIHSHNREIESRNKKLQEAEAAGDYLVSVWDGDNTHYGFHAASTVREHLQSLVNTFDENEIEKLAQSSTNP